MQSQPFVMVIIAWEFTPVYGMMMEIPYCDPSCHFTSVSAAFLLLGLFQFVIYSIPSKCNRCISVALRISVWDLTEQNESNNRECWWFQKLKSIRLENNLPMRDMKSSVGSVTNLSMIQYKTTFKWNLCEIYYPVFFFFENCWCLHLKTWSSFVFTNKSLKFSLNCCLLCVFHLQRTSVELHWIW